MENPLDTLSASSLRKLLIDEVKTFVECLDKESIDELQEKRTRLIAIYKAISEKEQLEVIPLKWGNHFTSKTEENASLQQLSDKEGS